MKKGCLGVGAGVVVILGVLAALVVIVGVFLIGQYNWLVSLETDVETQQAQVETVLQRRYDLIPNLVESAKGVMKQEQEVIEKLSEARTQYINAESGTEEKIQSAQKVERAINSFLAVAEDNPELKSSENVQSLMDELAGTENRIAVERKRYNEEVGGYNKAIRRFPTNIIASFFGFEEKPLFEAEEGAEDAPEVEF